MGATTYIYICISSLSAKLCYHAGGASRKSTDIIGEALNLYKIDLFNLYQHFKNAQFHRVLFLSLLTLFFEIFFSSCVSGKINHVLNTLYFHSKVLIINQTTGATKLFLLIYAVMKLLIHAWCLPLAPKSSYGIRGTTISCPRGEMMESSIEWHKAYY